MTENACIVDALAARRGGTAYAAVQVARHLARASTPPIVVTRDGSLVATGLAGSGARLLRLRREGRGELAARVAWEAAALPALARREGAGALLTWSGMLPRDAGVPTVAYLANPVMFGSAGRANRLRRLAARRTARRAAHVAVPTRAMADLVAPVLGRAPVVVPLGVDHERFRPAPAPGDELLYVADFYPHKRHDLALAVWAALPPPRPVLRFIGDGRVASAHLVEVGRRARELSGHGRIVIEDGLPLGRLVDALQRARAVIVPSQHESFCMPLLEAQACGVPAVARDTPVLRETGGPGTTFVAGDDVDGYVAAVARLLTDDRAHGAAREASLHHAAGYDWSRTASALATLLALVDYGRAA